MLSQWESGEQWRVEVSPYALSLDQHVKWVADPGAGAISTFSGVTRDSFKGKTVLKLEYECYIPMALKTLKDICVECLQRFDVAKVSVAHRTGTVGIGESSVIIAASSAHRKPSIEACHWLIDTLKAFVPIWKKEFFTDGQVWKENAESRLLDAES